jgi:hypothetical protein
MNNDVKTLSIAVRIVAGALLAVAILDLPYSYYNFLRITVCGSSIFMIWYFYKFNLPGLSWIFVIPAILFNPFMPIFLDKSTWVSIDIIISGLFFGSLMAVHYERDIE